MYMKFLQLFIALLLFNPVFAQEKEYTLIEMDSILGSFIQQQNIQAAASWCQYSISKTKNMDWRTFDPESAEYLAYTRLRNTLAVIYFNSGWHKEAAALYEEVLHVYRETIGETSSFYQDVLGYLVMLYRSTDNTKKLLTTYLNQQQIYENLGYQDSLFYMELLINIGNIHTENGAFSEALTYLNKADQGINAIKAWKSPAYLGVWYGIGKLYKKKGNRVVAIDKFNNSLKLAKVIYREEDPQYVNVAAILIDLARTYGQEGKHAKAELLLTEAGEIYKKYMPSGHYTKYMILSMKVNNYLNSLYLKRAKNEFLSEEELFNTRIEEMNRELIVGYKKIYGTAHPEYANALISLANMYSLRGEFVESVKRYREALTIRKEFYGEYHLDYLELSYGFCRDLEQAYNIEEAIETYLEINKVLLKTLKTNFLTQTEADRLLLLKELSYRFNVFYSFVVRQVQHYPELALAVLDVEMALKGLALESNLDIRARIVESKNDSLIQLYEEWNQMHQTLAKAYTMSTKTRQAQGIHLSSLEWKANVLEQEIAKKTTNLLSSFNHVKELNFKELQSELKADEVFIDFVAFSYFSKGLKTQTKLYYALIIRPNDPLPHFIPLTDNNKLEKILNTEVNSSSHNYITDKVESEDLYLLIWEPIEEWLTDAKHLYISPSGLLNKVAFGAILTDYDQERRLIQDYDIHYFNTISDFFHAKQKKEKEELIAREVVLVGGVDFGQDSLVVKLIDSTKATNRGHYGAFTYLEGTKSEVDDLEERFGEHSWKIQKLDKTLAKEETIKKMTGLKAPKILHIATHGFFFNNNNNEAATEAVGLQKKIQKMSSPLMRSGIALSGANKVWLTEQELGTAEEDGILTAYEVSNMDLHQTDLVVLSACETGRGDLNNTEGVMGLQRAFKLAGVEQLIISLWKVPDKQTSELMTLFYDFYLKGGAVHQAFQKAQRIMNERYDNPYYWAAFVLIE